MSRTRFEKFNCSIARSLDEIGDWWTLLIVREAFSGAHTFTEFVDNLGVARNILSDRLGRLISSGILEKKKTRPDTARYTYHLTKKGHDLLPVLVALMQWGDEWVSGKGREPVRFVDRFRNRPIRKLKVQSEGGKTLKMDDISLIPGPGASKLTRQRYKCLPD